MMPDFPDGVPNAPDPTLHLFWRGVPLEFVPQWRRVFQATQEILDLTAPCPLCGSHSLHRWYDLYRTHERVFEGKRFVGDGGLWECCSACRCYEHYSAAIPEWWSCDLEVDLTRVTHEPTAIEDARQAREASAGRT